MGPLEIFLIVFGIMLVAVSFIFSEHLMSLDGNKSYDANIAGVTKEIVQKEVEAEVANVIDEKIEQAEVRLDRITNQKIMALGEFSDDVNIKITKNHDEVMFLYDMLTDKEKTLKNTVRDIEALKNSIKYMNVENDKDNRELNESIDSKDRNKDRNKDTKSAYVIQKEVNTENDTITYTSSSIVDRIEMAEAMEKEKDVYKTDDKQDMMGSDNQNEPDTNESISSVNKNKQILDLFNKGKNDVDIAKELGIGVGEVKLVLGLFKTKR